MPEQSNTANSESTQSSGSNSVENEHPQWKRGVLMCVIAFAASSTLTGWMGASDVPDVVGQLEATRVEITAEHDGRIQELQLAAGQQVKTGDHVLTLERSSIQCSIDEHLAQIASLKSELAQAKAKSDVELAWRLKSLDSEILKAKLDAASYLKEQFAFQLKKEAWTNSVEKGIAFPAAERDPIVEPLVYRPSATTRTNRLQALLEQQEALNAVEVYGVQIEMCDDRVQNLESLKDSLPEKIAIAYGVERLEQQLADAESELACCREIEQQFELQAANYGVVTRLFVKAGDAVQAGDTIAELRDEAQRFVTAHVPSHVANRFAIDTEVTLVFPGDEYRRGVVVEVPLQADRQADVKSDEVTVPIRIEHTDKLWPTVPFGSTVSVKMPEPVEHAD